jgi:hypothetical protein
MVEVRISQSMQQPNNNNKSLFLFLQWTKVRTAVGAGRKADRREK